MISDLSGIVSPVSSFARGFSYPLRAVHCFRRHPSLLRYVVVPFSLNLLLFSLLAYFGLGWFDWALEHYAPGTELWFGLLLYYLAWIVALILTMVIVFFSFTLLGNLIASPFNEVLSERTEQLVSGELERQQGDVMQILKEARYAFFYELKKVGFFLVSMLILLAINFTPIVGPMIYAVLLVLFTLFCLGAEYIAFVTMRKQYTFVQLRGYLFKRPLLMAGYSCSVFVLLAVPFVQFFCIPLAVVGATLLWCDFPGEMSSRES